VPVAAALLLLVLLLLLLLLLLMLWLMLLLLLHAAVEQAPLHVERFVLSASKPCFKWHHRQGPGCKQEHAAAPTCKRDRRWWRLALQVHVSA
jgi:hypothetical protein